jgi:hypothetical protein
MANAVWPETHSGVLTMRFFVVVKNYSNEIVGNKTYGTLDEAKAVAKSPLGFYATAQEATIESPLDRKAIKLGSAQVVAKTPRGA